MSKTEQQRMNARFSSLVKEGIDEACGSEKITNSWPSLWEKVDFVSLNETTSLDDYINEALKRIEEVLKSDNVNLKYFDLKSCEQYRVIKNLKSYMSEETL